MRPSVHILSMGLLLALAVPALAAPATKDEAMTMVKVAIASIKKDRKSTRLNSSH